MVVKVGPKSSTCKVVVQMMCVVFYFPVRCFNKLAMFVCCGLGSTACASNSGRGPLELYLARKPCAWGWPFGILSFAMER